MPVKKPDRFASLPGKRGEICRNGVPVSASEWQPLQVLTAKWCRASGC